MVRVPWFTGQGSLGLQVRIPWGTGQGFLGVPVRVSLGVFAWSRVP